METHRIEIGGPSGGTFEIVTPDGFGALFVEAQSVDRPETVTDSNGDDVPNPQTPGEHAAESVYNYVRQKVAAKNTENKVAAARTQAGSENDVMRGQVTHTWTPAT